MNKDTVVNLGVYSILLTYAYVHSDILKFCSKLAKVKMSDPFL